MTLSSSTSAVAAEDTAIMNESQQLTHDVEVGDGLVHILPPRDPAVDVWNRGFCLFCISALILVGMATWQFMDTTVVYDVNAKWRPVVDILNASNITSLKFVHDVGDYGLQGLAMNVECTTLYEFHTLGVRVLRVNNVTGGVLEVLHTRVYTSDDFPIIFSQPVAHIGGIDYALSVEHGEELWLATHSEGIDGEGAIIAVDPVSLDVKKDRVVRAHYNLDWVAFHQGILYYGGFFNVKEVNRVDVATLESLDNLLLQLPPHLKQGGINYVQSGAFDFEGRLVLLGDDYQCTVYFIDIETGEFVKSQPLLLGSETDGITFNHATKSMLVGYNRKHSHEQVMGEAPMVSVIELQLY